jgi:hypothetical protein
MIKENKILRISNMNILKSKVKTVKYKLMNKTNIKEINIIKSINKIKIAKHNKIFWTKNRLNNNKIHVMIINPV